MNANFERFTERARTVLTLAQEEAQRFNHNYIGTEHVLLGLVREGKGVAAKVLSNLGIELMKVRGAVETIIGRGERQVMGEIGLTPRAKKMIELAVDEARRLGHHYIGTEHLLLGLIREGDGIAAGVLENLGVNLESARTEVGKILTQSSARPHLRPRAVHLPERFQHPESPRRYERWEYEVLWTHTREGAIEATAIEGEALHGSDVNGMRIHHVLELMGADRWELVGIDPNPRGAGSDAALYVFKRPK